MTQEKNEKSESEEEIEEEEEELESKMEESDNISLKEHSNLLEEEIVVGKKFVGSLSEDLAHIGHIDSSETSDDSPEGMSCVKLTSVGGQ